ncbi:head completion/stabilization protein [Xenorhabdus cabanillasii]|uniref:Head completion/stabilization protein n=1 Tax=Xenorhabdus cabanillasii JM26 TaxID=1427517 RepID=W1IPQ0_9GAMM|nr:head completion/stabilization protein [Xenorhabdus cabanillasii]PHM75691.1 head protein [Xenorhabdus cabanillasii JM26]CDL79813.1 Head completion/stabilization protein [Xenorhabdus cabanillasii JM26]
MDFIAPEPAHDGDVTLSSDPFYPAISLSRYRDEMRTDGTVTAARLKPAIANAIVEVNRELHRWSLDKLQQGYATLAAMPASPVNGESELTALYHRAVFCLTKANLTERYRDIDTTQPGTKKAEAMETTIDDLWRDAQWALRRLQGQAHSLVELI